MDKDGWEEGEAAAVEQSKMMMKSEYFIYFILFYFILLYFILPFRATPAAYGIS